MSNQYMESLPINRQERLAFIELNLLYTGAITRKKLKDRYGISDAAATRDLVHYQGEFPLNTIYDRKKKSYILKEDSFYENFDIDVNLVLLELTGTRQSFIQADNESDVSSIVLEMMSKPKADVISVITRSMVQNQAIEIEYYSPEAEKKQRIVIPHSVVNTGERWHFRAYDRCRETFIDFVATRIISAKSIDVNVEKYETKDNDLEWNAEVRLILVPHPHIENKEPIEMDFGMDNGELKVTVKAALMGYFLRHWNIDSSPRERLLDGKEYQLWLKNNEVILSFKQRVLVPGYENH